MGLRAGIPLRDVKSLTSIDFSFNANKEILVSYPSNSKVMALIFQLRLVRNKAVDVQKTQYFKRALHSFPQTEKLLGIKALI